MKRSSWIDKFIVGNEMKKIAIKVEANYIDRIKRLIEDTGRGQAKWSSIEEALSDFATRNGFERKQMKLLQREAMSRIADKDVLKKLEEEGLGSQAVEFMSRAKGKHTEQSGSPFVLNPEDAALAKKIRHKERNKRDLSNSDGPENSNNEFSSTVDKEASADYALNWLKKFAADQIIDLPQDKEEAMESLTKELRILDIKTPYKIVRHGFRFTGSDGKTFPQSGEPVKVTVYKYSFYKRALAEAINVALRDQLSQELSLEEWLNYLSKNVGPQARALKVKLEQLQRDLYSEEAVYLQTRKDRTDARKIKGVLQLFPASYQLEILKMLCEGQFRHLTSEEGREHAEIHATGFRLGSFILMDSFDPFIKVLPKLTDRDQTKEFIRAIVEAKKNTFSYEEFIKLLEELGIESQLIPSGQEYQIMNLGGGKLKLRVDNGANPDYKPTTNPLSPDDMTDPDTIEEQLQRFQDQLGAVLMNDIRQIEKARETGKAVDLTPLAYEKQEDGSYKPLSLLEIGNTDYTLQELPGGVENPSAGMHPSFTGKVPQSALPKNIPMTGLGKNPSRWQGMMSDTPTSAPKKEKSTTVKTPGKSRWDTFKKSSVYHEMLKLAGLIDPWISDRGESFDTEEEMKSSMLSQILEENEADIVAQAASQLMAFVSQMPDEAPTLEQLEDTTEPEESTKPELTNLELPNELRGPEEVPFAAAAETIVRLRRLAVYNSKVREMLKKYER